jgi:hypothetical protein
VIDAANKRVISAWHRCYSSISNITTTIDSAEIFSGLHRQYTPLIFSQLDKNSGSTFICCRETGKRHRKKHELRSLHSGGPGPASFKTSNNIENFLVTQSQFSFQFRVSMEKSPGHYGSCRTPKTIIENNRPIASYTRHRLKKIYNVTAQAIFYLP